MGSGGTAEDAESAAEDEDEPTVVGALETLVRTRQQSCSSPCAKCRARQRLGQAAATEQVFKAPAEAISASFETPESGRLPLPRTAPRPFALPPPTLVMTQPNAKAGDGQRFLCAFVDNTLSMVRQNSQPFPDRRRRSI